MPRRVSLPAADDLFRPTAPDAASSGASVRAVPDQPSDGTDDGKATAAGETSTATSGAVGRARPSGRMTR